MTRDELKNALVESGNRLYVILRKTTDNGTKYYDFYSLYVELNTKFPYQQCPKIRRITYVVADVSGATYCKRNECIKTYGDYHDITYNLGQALDMKLNCEVLW